MGLLLTATEALLAQQISVVEWAAQWECCAADLASSQYPAPQQARDCLDSLKDFATLGTLSRLDAGLAQLRELAAEWDHWWWVAQRSGCEWPPPRRRAERLKVTRQAGRSRVSWRCPQCTWSLSWDVETAAWQVLDWPGLMECPLCSIASNDGPPCGKSPRSECER
ncbi:MAG: hypothetical protein KF760_07295 [Candidatus Eremiobacteraeota bacterium]|nr:hypothetical protein [Candidatus Eremiobacteraeota bacterium]